MLLTLYRVESNRNETETITWYREKNNLAKVRKRIMKKEFSDLSLGEKKKY